MDNLIARKLWRAIVVSEASGESYMVRQEDGGKVPVPPFSTSTEDSHKVAEFLRTKGWFFRIKHHPELNEYRACFYKEDGRVYTFVKGDTIPYTICLAALACISNNNVI